MGYESGIYLGYTRDLLGYVGSHEAGLPEAKYSYSLFWNRRSAKQVLSGQRNRLPITLRTPVREGTKGSNKNGVMEQHAKKDFKIQGRKKGPWIGGKSGNPNENTQGEVPEGVCSSRQGLQACYIHPPQLARCLQNLSTLFET